MDMTSSEIRARGADRILARWRGRQVPALDLPAELRPRNLAQAYGLQETVSAELGAIGGWRICWRGSPTASSGCAPLPLGSIHPEPRRLAREPEAVVLQPEICFRMGRNLPDYDAPYTRQQVLAAIECCHPAVDILRQRVMVPAVTDALSDIADSCAHGTLVYGRATSVQSGADLSQLPISVLQNGTLVCPPAAPGRDVFAALQWLANEGSRWGGGLMVSQLVAIDIGRATVRVPTRHPARIVIGGLGGVSLRFG